MTSHCTVHCRHGTEFMGRQTVRWPIGTPETCLSELDRQSGCRGTDVPRPTVSSGTSVSMQSVAGNV